MAASLDKLIEQRLTLMHEREVLREKLQSLSVEIDARLQQSRGEQILAGLSDSDRKVLLQTIRAKGIPSKEAVNG